MGEGEGGRAGVGMKKWKIKIKKVYIVQCHNNSDFYTILSFTFDLYKNKIEIGIFERVFEENLNQTEKKRKMENPNL